MRAENAAPFMARIQPRTNLRIGGRPFTTGPDGSAVVEGLQEGPWMLRLMEPGFEPFRAIDFEVKAGENTELPVEMRASGVICLIN